MKACNFPCALNSGLQGWREKAGRLSPVSAMDRGVVLELGWMVPNADDFAVG